METHFGDEQVLTGWRWGAACLALVVLLLGPITIVATMADPPVKDAPVLAAPYAGPIEARAPLNFVPLDSGDIGHFAFGYVEFDWDPKAPGGVPGFDSWPPGSRAR